MTTDRVTSRDKILKLLRTMNEAEHDIVCDAIIGLMKPNFKGEIKQDVDTIGALKKLITFDFDGVIHKYESKWNGALNIPDAPVDGVFKYIEKCVYHPEFVVGISSTRLKYEGSKDAIIKWFKKHGMPQDIIDKLYFFSSKPASHVHIDDRVVTFNGHVEDYPIESISDFKPWNNNTINPIESLKNSIRLA